MEDDADPPCDWTGVCKPPDSDDDREVSSCIFCGKELVKVDGHWKTYDWELFVTKAPDRHDGSAPPAGPG
jgi:hypothetical protein